MQMPKNVSYVVTDPKGTILVECGKMLANEGYRIKVLNTINFKKSMHYKAVLFVFVLLSIWIRGIIPFHTFPAGARNMT